MEAREASNSSSASRDLTFCPLPSFTLWLKFSEEATSISKILQVFDLS
jgi:hypothetical protein